MHILIAEDDAYVRSLVSNVARDLGHDPIGAENGARALELFKSGAVDVVVSDWVMPHLDGMQLCRCVRSDPGRAYTYFILLTALGDAEHRLAGMHAGADDYVPKPFDLTDIEASLVAAERVTTLHRRRETLLRQARDVAAESKPGRILEELVSQALDLVDGSAAVVTRWDDQQSALVPVAPLSATQLCQPLAIGEGASGRAALRGAPVVLNRTVDGSLDPTLADARIDSAVAVPLLHGSRLVGTLAVGRATPAGPFGDGDIEVLETLAATAVSALVALERVRLDGVQLAARTAQHELNNQLAVARGYAEMLACSADLPGHLHGLATEVIQATDRAARTVRRLRGINRIHEHQWTDPSDSTIDLARSH